jgi:ABC-2 type transport system ATP-binding protein
MDAVIRTSDLTKHYGRVRALDSVELEVPRGIVLGYLGPNGAGKTTTIRLLAGLLRPTRGRAEVLGYDTVRDADELQARIGYLPGDFVAYPDLTGEQYLRYLGSLRGGVDPGRVALLAKRLELDLSRRIGTLSHGNRQKVGLLQAFMHDPELLLLDEPSAGLDPLMQREFLGMVREARDAGRTVFLSSHIMSEVQAVADLVAILRHGRLVVVEAIDALTARSLRRIELTFEGRAPEDRLQTLEGVRDVHTHGQVAHVVVEGSTAPLFAGLGSYRIDDIVTREADLEEIFLTYYGANEREAAEGPAQEV